MNCFPLSETSSSGNPNLAKISVRALMTSRDFFQDVRFRIRRIIISVDQYELSPDWTNEIYCAFHPRTTRKRRWLKRHVLIQRLIHHACLTIFDHFSLLHRPCRVRKNEFLEIVLSLQFPDASRALVIEFVFAETVEQQFDSL